MKYRNIKTGAIVDVNSKVKGDWELVEESAPTPIEKTAPKKKTVKRSK